MAILVVLFALFIVVQVFGVKNASRFVCQMVEHLFLFLGVVMLMFLLVVTRAVTQVATLAV